MDWCRQQAVIAACHNSCACFQSESDGNRLCATWNCLKGACGLLFKGARIASAGLLFLTARLNSLSELTILSYHLH